MSQAEIDVLRAEVVRLTARLDELEQESTAPSTVFDPPVSTGVTRRGWMRAAAAAAVGGAAAAVVAERPVAAAAGDPVRAGQTTTTAVRTRLDYTGSDEGVGTLIQSGSTFDGSFSAHPAAVGAWSTSSSQPSGLYGFTDVTPTGTPVAGVVGRATREFASGVLGEAPEGAGLRGEGKYGLDASGDTAAIVVTPSDFRFPTDGTDFHRGGELFARAASDSGLAVELWYCTVGGSPGEWVQLAGPGQPGGFRAVSPTRVYDSRVPAPEPGRISGGEDRTVDITQARDLATGSVLGTVVTAGATALSFNIAVVDTSAGGFLSVAPSFETAFSAATINWSASGQILNNGSVTSLGNDGNVKVFAGGAGATHFVIDVTGYWE